MNLLMNRLTFYSRKLLKSYRPFVLCHYGNSLIVVTAIYLLSLQQSTRCHYDNLITVITTVYLQPLR